MNDIRTNLAALYLLKNLSTESPREIAKDIVDNGGVSNIFKAIDRFPNSVAIVSTGLSCLVHLLHQRGLPQTSAFLIDSSQSKKANHRSAYQHYHFCHYKT